MSGWQTYRPKCRRVALTMSNDDAIGQRVLSRLLFVSVSSGQLLRWSQVVSRFSFARLWVGLLSDVMFFC